MITKSYKYVLHLAHPLRTTEIPRDIYMYIFIFFTSKISEIKTNKSIFRKVILAMFGPRPLVLDYDV